METDFTPVNTHNVEITFGKHKGELITRVPQDYLRWMCNAFQEQPSRYEWFALAKSELIRREVHDSSSVKVSMHAIDKSSRLFWRLWTEARDTENKDERAPGFATWTRQKAEEALDNGEVINENQTDSRTIKWMDKKWVFTAGKYPTLKTIK